MATKEKPDVFTDEQLTFLKTLFPEVSQFEKLKQEIKITFNKNIATLQERCEATEAVVDTASNAINILESDVRTIGGKGIPDKDKLPKPVKKGNKERFSFNLLDI